VERDMDLVKAILLELEENTPGTSYGSGGLEVEGHSVEEVHFHLYLLKQAGLIEAEEVTSFADVGPAMMPLWMTWYGYEFLDAARNDGVWDKAKGMLLDKGLGMGFETLKALLLKLGREGLEGVTS